MSGDAGQHQPIRSVPDLDDEAAESAEALLLRVGRGDQSAFEDLYDRVIGTVLGMARRVLRDEAQAEEVAQEVMVEVWRTAPRFDDSARQRPRLGGHAGTPTGRRPGARGPSRTRP